MTLIDEAHRAGTRLQPACAELGLTPRTYRRWRASDGVRRDARPDAERPALADTEQRYIASQSTFYRILRAEGEQHHRGRN